MNPTDRRILSWCRLHADDIEFAPRRILFDSWVAGMESGVAQRMSVAAARLYMVKTCVVEDGDDIDTAIAKTQQRLPSKDDE